MTRLRLDPLHPRDLLRPTARYLHATRSVAVSIEPTSDAATLPPDGLNVALSGLEPQGGGLVFRQDRTVVRPGERPGELMASWSGAERGTATFALDVDDYPRAFVFSIDCAAAADGRVQGPQRDWRRLRIVDPPAGDPRFLAAPVASLPLRLAIDAPPDTFTSSGSVSVVIRPVGGGADESAVERTAWTADADRQVTHEPAASPPGQTWAVMTRVTDWSIAPSGQGFTDVDVAVDARLAVPGLPAPLIESRGYVFDGRPPLVETPAEAALQVGRNTAVAIRVADDAGNGTFAPPDRRPPGVSGLKSVEWSLDLERTGEPKGWKPALHRSGSDYEIPLETAALPLGTRLELFVRATDNVGLTAPPKRIWLAIAPSPASKKNTLGGKVLVDGRGEQGIPVTLSGPGGERKTTSAAGGVFRFEGLDPGAYEVAASGPVRNRVRQAPPAKVTVEASPAPEASTVLTLK